ncbi:protein FAM234A isoform X2 [Chanos chanos]|uniref:Protein FAM234A isoform X2 n=1 Tax=Chanos chanos TaxID=29144 RepID=A0A6J2UZP9_CHACN|nr:protein FAM234A isoform X2 [Chanos chanos]
MVDAAEHSTEAEPLKGEETVVGVTSVTDPSPFKKSDCAGRLGMSHLSGWRTGTFLLSLFLCLTVVFAFSFILPCPVRPQYQRTWNRTIPGAVTYDFLAVEDATKDKVRDVFIIYKRSEGMANNTCTSEGLSAPCLFLLAVDGTDGETLWERPLSADFDWAVCGVGGLSETGTGCLIAHNDNLTAVDTHTGVILWQQLRTPVRGGDLPLVHLPDLDGDGATDFALVTHSPSQTVLAFVSGRTGDVIGSEVVVDSGTSLAHLPYITASGGQYLLLHKDSGLYAVGLWWLAGQAKSGLEVKLKKDKNWEERASSRPGHILIFESVSLRRVVEVRRSGRGSVSPLLLLTDSTITLLHENLLTASWSMNISNLLSAPAFGHYNTDEVPDLVIEEDIGNSTKRVVILDGHTGSALWEDVEEKSSYLLHPYHSNLLLERKSPFQHIIAFKATLLERSRHASYLVLTGQDGGQSDGVLPVTLTKRKIKDDVPESSVLRVGGAGGVVVSTDSEEYIKEIFYRLRFSNEPQ